MCARSFCVRSCLALLVELNLCLFACVCKSALLFVFLFAWSSGWLVSLVSWGVGSALLGSGWVGSGGLLVVS